MTPQIRCVKTSARKRNMAEMLSDGPSDVTDPVPNPPKQSQKRRRIINPSSITTVPVYSNKVNSSLNLDPVIFKHANFTDQEKGSHLWAPSPPRPKEPAISIDLSDSEEEPELTEPQEILCSPSPPPPPLNTTMKQSRRANKKLREINKKMDAIGSLVCFSPEPRVSVIEHNNSPSPVKDYDDDDDIIIISSNSRKKRRLQNVESSDSAREISLKFRCRTELYKIPILTTAPLSKAVEQLAIKLKVSPSHILLLKKDIDLPVHSSIDELGLSIVDIIDCVITDSKCEESNTGHVITVRLQGKEKTSVQEHSIEKNAPFRTILALYKASLPVSLRSRARFYFDGSRVSSDDTPADLEMEDGDVIEVWT